MLNCQSAQEECIAKNKELQQQKLDNITEEYESLLGYVEAVKSSSEAMVNFYAAEGRNVNGPETVAQINSQIGNQQQISGYITQQISAYRAEMSNAARIFGENSNEYREAATKLQEMQKALTESNTAIYELGKRLMDIELEPLSNLMEKLQSFGKRLESILTLNQKRSIAPKEQDYMNQVNNNNEMISIALRSYNTKKNDIISNGWLEDNPNYQEYIKLMRQDLDTILQLRIANEELKASILDSRWKSFDDLHKKMTQSIEDYDYLRSKIKDEELFDDDGEGWNLTERGFTAIALMGESMATHKNNIADYRKALEKLNEQLAANPEMADIINEKSEEYIKLIRDEIDAVDNLKDSLTDLYITQAQNEQAALEKLISTRKEALSQKKAYYDYDKNLKSQNKEINQIQAQINALSGVSNATAKAQRARLEAQLKEKQEDLADTRYNHRYDMLNQGYDKLSEDSQEALDKTLRHIKANSDAQEQIVDQMLGTIRTNYKDSYETINDVIKETGLVIHDITKESIGDLTDAASALGVYSNAVAKVYNTASTGEANNILTDKIITSTPTSDVGEQTVLGHNETAIANAAAQQKATMDAAKAEEERLAKIEAERRSLMDRIADLQLQAESHLRAADELRTAQQKQKEAEKKAKKDSKKKGGTVVNKIGTAVDYSSQINDHESIASNLLAELEDLKRELSRTSSYKRGTLGTLEDELAFTHQGEIIRRSDGAILRQLPAGTQVIPKIASENLLKWAQIDPFKSLKDGMAASGQVTNMSNNNAPIMYYDSIIHIDGNVDADMMDRVEEMGIALLKSRDFTHRIIGETTKEFKREFNKRF